MRSKVTAPLLALLGVALLAGGVALAHGVPSTGFSGYEVFAGLPCSIGGATTCGTSFAGWTHPADAAWQSPQSPLRDGGNWAASVSYTGTPGPGNTVTIVRGVWGWRQPNGTLHQGRVLLGGTVRWPTALEDIGGGIGCGVGVAKVEANISLGASSTDAGDINGCLNDAPGVVPPRIWGKLTLTTPPH